MKRLLVILVLVAMTGCAQVSCEDRDRDGGIGGTGNCEKDAPAKVAVFGRDGLTRG